MINPGTVCPTCERRMAYPKKPDSPESAMKTYRCPTQEAKDVLRETEQAAAEYVGLDGRKFVDYELHSIGLVEILKDPEMKDWFKR